MTPPLPYSVPITARKGRHIHSRSRGDGLSPCEPKRRTKSMSQSCEQMPSVALGRIGLRIVPARRLPARGVSVSGFLWRESGVALRGPAVSCVGVGSSWLRHASKSSASKSSASVAVASPRALFSRLLEVVRSMSRARKCERLVRRWSDPKSQLRRVGVASPCVTLVAAPLERRSAPSGYRLH